MREACASLSLCFIINEDPKLVLQSTHCTFRRFQLRVSSVSYDKKEQSVSICICPIRKPLEMYIKRDIKYLITHRFA